MWRGISSKAGIPHFEHFLRGREANQIVTDYSEYVLREEFNKHCALANTASKGSHCLATCYILRRINAIGDNLCYSVTVAC